MATYTIIRSVTEALLTILQNDLGGPSGIIPSASIVAAPPETVEKVTGQTLILYLYQVLESPYLKNTGTQAVQISSSTPAQTVQIQRDPMALDLYYLLIPFSTESNFLDTYDILGAAMRSFHDHGIFSPGALGVSTVMPEEENLEFRLSMNPLSTSDLLRLWEAVHRPYRLSVAYVVRTVQVDSTLSTTAQLTGQRRFTAGGR